MPKVSKYLLCNYPVLSGFCVQAKGKTNAEAKAGKDNSRQQQEAVTRPFNCVAINERELGDIKFGVTSMLVRC